jgi:two-component sensor histidine kinase
VSGRRILAGGSLRGRVVLLLALAMLPAGLLAISQAISNYGQSAELQRRANLQRATLAIVESRNEFVRTREALETIDTALEVSVLKPEECTELLESIVAANPVFGSASVSDSDGLILCSFPAAPSGLRLQGLDLYRNQLERRDLVLTGFRKGEISGEQVVIALLARRDDRANLIGTLAISVRARMLLWRVEGSRPEGVKAFALVDRTGHAEMLSPEGGGAGDGDGDPERTAEAAAKARAWLPSEARLVDRIRSKISAFRDLSRDGRERFYAITPVYGEDLFLVTTGDGGPVAASWRLISAVALPILMWLAAIFAAWYAVDRLVLRWVLHLQRLAQAYAGGDLSRRPAEMRGAPQELADLGSTLSGMADTLEERERGLRLALDRQKALLKEVYHRVKNNLQIITSLLNLQMRKTEGEEAGEALHLVQNRIQALALVHRHLYQHDGLEQLEMDRFLRELAAYLAEGAAHPDSRLVFDIDPIRADADFAVPMALLLTEAFQSALDRCVRDGDSPIRFSFKQRGEGRVFVEIRCASATPPAAHDEAGAGLAAQLMRGFARQLGGEIAISEENGGYAVSAELKLAL